MSRSTHWTRALPATSLVAVLLLLLLAFSARPVAAAALVVNSAADTVADDGECTLREAISAANSDTASGATAGECVAGSGADTITFAADYTITLIGSQLPAVRTEMTITGNGAANTIIQASTCNPVTLPGGCTPATYRVLEVTSSTGNLTLDGVTVRHGRCALSCATYHSFGGGILKTSGTLTVTNSTLSGNTADYGGGIYNNFGTLTVTNSTLSGNSAIAGGGIFIFPGAPLTVTNSTLSGNTAYYGGGIYNNYGTLTVTNSTLSGNTAESGGGILNNNGNVTVTNSTLSGNSATSTSAGGIYNFGTLTVTNSTLSGNSAVLEGGGIYNYGVATVTRSLVSGNSAGTGAEVYVYEFSGTPTADAYNVFGHNGLSNADAFVNFTPGANDFNATSDSGSVLLTNILDTTLSPNGGPTLTHALVAGSPAIDFAPSADCAADPVFGTDQRGEPRSINIPGTGSDTTNLCDTGAFEVQLPIPTSFCPVDEADTLRTDLLGVGMGSPTRGLRNVKLGIPTYQDVDSLYAQLAAVEVGQMKWVRFSVKDQPYVQVKPPTSPAIAPATVKWWGSGELPASPWVKGAFFFGPKGNRSPRALVVWPTYNTTEAYANVLSLFDDSSTNWVHTPIAPMQTQLLNIPPTQADGASITVNVAVVDVNKDARSVILTVEAGGVSEQRVITVPNRKESLNVETFVLAGVPAGTDEVTITLESPEPSEVYPFGGDSAAMVGASANYACGLVDDN